MKKRYIIAALSLFLVACDASDQKQDNSKVEDNSGPPINDEIVDFNVDLELANRNAEENAPPAKIEEVMPDPEPGMLAVSQSSLDLGLADQNGKSDEYSLIVQNIGEMPVRLFSVRTDSKSVTLKNDCPPELAASDTCTVKLSMHTDVAFENLDDRLTIDSDAENGSVVVPLSGAVFATLEEEPETEEGPSMASLIEAERRKRLAEAKNRSFTQLNVGFGSVMQVSDPVKPPVEYVAEDPDYRALEDITEVVSTFPVNNCRIMPDGTRINASLDTTILTEQEGSVRAIVLQNIVSSCGNILVPAGSEILGTSFQSENTEQSRAMVAWYRIRRAKDNASIKFEGMAADMSGRPGIPGVVYTRTLEKYGLTGALIGLSALVSFLTPVDDDQASAAVSDATNKLGQLSAQTLEQNMDIKPIVEARKGAIIQVVAHMQDIYFPEPIPLKVAEQ
ncbi:TraB/TrbI/VirB10 family type IV secretion system protein (plasmid) [Thalassospira sp. SM2505]